MKRGSVDDEAQLFYPEVVARKVDPAIPKKPQFEDAGAQRIAAALGHAFKQPALLVEALTHRSLANERPAQAPRDNERLEFLGDAVISMTVSDLLWERFPAASEGELTRRRADLVCERSLATLAKKLGIDSALRLGRGEEQSGGHSKPRLLASAFEACMGAVYLDGGGAHAIEIGKRLFGPLAADDAPGAHDFKTRVQELVQSEGKPAPKYDLLRSEGPQHAREFIVAMQIDGAVVSEGRGQSKLEAEQRAARLALRMWSSQDGDDT